MGNAARDTGREPNEHSMFAFADPEVQAAYQGWLAGDEEMRARSEAAARAAEAGDGPSNPVSVRDLQSMVERAGRERPSRAG